MEKQEILPLEVPHLLRERGVRRFIPVSRQGLRDMVARGEFPKPVRMGPKMTVWHSSPVLAVLEKMERKQKELVA